MPTLAEMAQGFESEVRTKVEKPFAEGLAALYSRYNAYCAASLKSATSAGKLDEAVAIKQEMEAIAQGKEMPVVDTVGTKPELVRLRSIWREEMMKLEKERGARLNPIFDSYNSRLQRLEESLTRQSKLPEALQVRELQMRHKDMADAIKSCPASLAVDTSVFDTVNELVIKMNVDGQDTVKVRDGRLWIEHENWNAPSSIIVNGTRWSPHWTGKNSDRFARFIPALEPFTDSLVTLTQNKGRGSVKILELPGITNNRTLSFRIDDGAGGSDEYIVTLSW